MQLCLWTSSLSQLAYFMSILPFSFFYPLLLSGETNHSFSSSNTHGFLHGIQHLAVSFMWVRAIALSYKLPPLIHVYIKNYFAEFWKNNNNALLFFPSSCYSFKYQPIKCCSSFYHFGNFKIAWRSSSPEILGMFTDNSKGRKKGRTLLNEVVTDEKDWD